MRKHFCQSDGRLKTGRISLIFFLCLMLSLGLLFKLQQPVDKAIVVVRHIFAVPPKTESERKTEKVVAVAKPKPETSVKPKSKVPEKDSEPVKVARVEPAAKPAAPAPKNTEKPKIDEKPEKAPVAKKTASESPVKKPVVKPEEIEIVKLPAVIPAEVTRKSPVQPAKDPVPDILPEELVVAPQLLQSSTLLSSAPQAEEPAGQTAVTLLSKAQRQLLMPKPVKVRPEKISSPATGFTALKPLKFRKTAKKGKNKTETGSFKAVSSSRPAKPEVVKKGKTSGITVAKKEYKKLHHAWQAAGRSEKDDGHVIPLQIENLRAAYDLLQMKAVVIRPDESCIDLADGSRIPRASLDSFSGTVMRVEDPWQKWGLQLKAAGLRPGQSFKVRYYLYDFVRRSIYARVNRAYQWSLAKGLIQAETRPDEVDVLGRTFVINRSGGGAFGVFVPLSLKTSDGRRVEIDPLCFSNAPDIDALHSAGLI